MTQYIADKFNALHLAPQRPLHADNGKTLAGRSGLGYLLTPVVGALALVVLLSGSKTPHTANATVHVSADTGLAVTYKVGKVDWPAPRDDVAADFDVDYEIILGPAADSAGDPLQTATAYSAELELARAKLMEGFGAEVEMTDELLCLAQNIYFEARSEPLAGKLAVGHVVMNRVSSRNFPESICAVVQQGGERTRYRCQFSWWCDGKSDDPRNASAWDESITLAHLVLIGSSSDPTAGALWYHADYVKPKWRTAFKRGPKIGRHIFYSKKPVRKGTQVASNAVQ